MKRVFFIILNIFFIFLGGMSLSLAVGVKAEKENIKIGCIDMQEAIQMTSVGKKAKLELEKAFQKKQEEINKAQETLKAKEQDLLSSKSKILSEKALRKRKEKLRQEFQEFQVMVQNNTLQIQKQERELLNPIVQQLGKIIEDIAKKEKFTIILERSRQNVLWLNNDIDLTKRVAQAFEDKNKNKKTTKKTVL